MGTLGISDLPAPARRALRPLMILTALGLIAAAVLHGLVLGHAQEELTRQRTAYEEARHQQLILKNTRTQQERVRELRGHLARVWEKLPAEEEFTATAMQVAELGRTAGVSIPGMTYSQKKAGNGLPAKASLVFEATGRYRDIYRFIHRLEDMEPYVVIEQVDAARANESSQAQRHSVRFHFTVVTYLKVSRSSEKSA